MVVLELQRNASQLLQNLLLLENKIQNSADEFSKLYENNFFIPVIVLARDAILNLHYIIYIIQNFLKHTLEGC